MEHVNISTSNLSLEFPEILSQTLICYHWLSVSGNSKRMHCGILINMPYTKVKVDKISYTSIHCRQLIYFCQFASYWLVLFVGFSYHLELCIDAAVSAILTIFKLATTMTPKFKKHGGSYRENLALQNIQVRNHDDQAFTSTALSGRLSGDLIDIN